MAQSIWRTVLAWLVAAVPLAAAEEPAAPAAESPVVELRVYYANAGKLDALHARFRDHTCKLFEKHGMVNVGYWVPVANPDHRLIYLLSFPSREARESAWKAFVADPAWHAARMESEKEGPLVARVESTLLTRTDFSPQKPAASAEPRVFELRTYTATPGNLAALLDRFRQHTCRLFEKHGMTNVAYFTLLPDQKGADTTLIYLLSHRSEETARTSFEAFRRDADWIAARAASEQKAGGSLTAEGGVQSLMLQATDYSPLK